MTQWRPSSYNLPTVSNVAPPPPPTPNPVEQAEQQQQMAIVPYQQPQQPSSNPFAAFGRWAITPVIPESAVSWMPDWIEPVGRFATRMTSPAEIAFTVGTLGWGAGAGAALRGATAARGPVMSRLGRVGANIVEPVYRGTPKQVGQGIIDARALGRTFGSVPTSMKNILPRTEAELFLIGGSQAAVEAVGPTLVDKFGPILGGLGTVPAAIAGGVAGAIGGPALRSSVVKATKMIAPPTKAPKGDAISDMSHGKQQQIDLDKPKKESPYTSLQFKELGSETDPEKRAMVEPIAKAVIDDNEKRYEISETDRIKQEKFNEMMTKAIEKLSLGKLGKPMVDWINKNIVKRGAPSAGGADRMDSVINAALVNKIKGAHAVDRLADILKYDSKDIERMFGVEDLQTNNIIPNSGKLFTDEFIKVLKEKEIDGQTFLLEGDAVNLQKLMETIPAIAKGDEERITSFGPFEEYFDDEMKDFFVRDSIVTRVLERIGQHFGLKVSQIEARGHTALYDYLLKYEDFQMNAKDWRAIGPDPKTDPSAFKDWVRFISNNFEDKGLDDFSVKRYIPRVIVKLNDAGEIIDEGLLVGKEAWIFGPSKKFEERRVFNSIQDLLDAGFNIRSYHEAKLSQMSNRVSRIMTKVLSHELEAQGKSFDMSIYGFADTVKTRKWRTLLKRELFETEGVDYDKLGAPPLYDKKFMQEQRTRFREDAELEADGKLTKKEINKIVDDRVKQFQDDIVQEVIDQNTNPVLLTRVLENRNRYSSVKYLDMLTRRYIEDNPTLIGNEEVFSLQAMENALPNLLKSESANISSYFHKNKWKYIKKEFHDLAREYGDQFPALKRITTPSLYDLDTDDGGKIALEIWNSIKNKRGTKAVMSDFLAVNSLADVHIAIRLGKVLELYNNGNQFKFDADGNFIDFYLPIKDNPEFQTFINKLAEFNDARAIPISRGTPPMPDGNQNNLFTRRYLYLNENTIDPKDIPVARYKEYTKNAENDYNLFMRSMNILINDYHPKMLKKLETRRTEAEKLLEKMLPVTRDPLPVGHEEMKIINGRSTSLRLVNRRDPRFWDHMKLYAEQRGKTLDEVMKDLSSAHGYYDWINATLFIDADVMKNAWNNKMQAGDYNVNQYNNLIPEMFPNYNSFLSHVFYHESAHALNVDHQSPLTNSGNGLIKLAITDNGDPVPLGQKFLIFLENQNIRRDAGINTSNNKVDLQKARYETRTDEEGKIRRQMDGDILPVTRTIEGIYFSRELPKIKEDFDYIINNLPDNKKGLYFDKYYDQSMLSTVDKIKLGLAEEIAKDQNSIYLSPVSKEEYLKEIEDIFYNQNFNSEGFKAEVKQNQRAKPPQRLVITGSRDFGIDQGPYRDGTPSFPYSAAEYEKDKKFATEILDAWIEKYGVPKVIIHGGAEGADRLVADIAASKGIEVKEVRPNFDLFPTRAEAYNQRNRDMLDNYQATHLLAFPSKWNKRVKKVNNVTTTNWDTKGGTMNTVMYATIDKNLPVTDFTNYMGKQYAGDPTRVPREAATDLIRSLKSQRPIARGDETRWQENLHYRVDTNGTTLGRKFSALNARFKNGTILEDVWQLDIKLEGTQGAAQVVPEGGRALTPNMKTKEGKRIKGSRPIMKRFQTRKQLDDAYEDLWRRYFKENPELVQQLIKESEGKALYDGFSPANDLFKQNQARTITKLLDEQFPLSKRELTKQSFVKRFTRDVTEAFNNKNEIYVFGDNVAQKGTQFRPRKTQAQIRGLKNAFGIPTKQDVGTQPIDYWYDINGKMDEKNRIQIDQAIKEIEEYSDQNDMPINIPWDSDRQIWNIGTGAAKLQQNAPDTFNYLQDQLTALSQRRELILIEGDLRKAAREEANRQVSELGSFNNINQIDSFTDTNPIVWKGLESENIELIENGEINKEALGEFIKLKGSVEKKINKLPINKNVVLSTNGHFTGEYGSPTNTSTQVGLGHHFNLNYFNKANGYSSPYMQENSFKVIQFIRDIRNQLINKQLSEEDKRFLTGMGFMSKIKNKNMFINPDASGYIFNEEFFNLNKFTNTLIRGEGFKNEIDDSIVGNYHFRKEYGDTTIPNLDKDGFILNRYIRVLEELASDQDQFPNNWQEVFSPTINNLQMTDQNAVIRTPSALIRAVQKNITKEEIFLTFEEDIKKLPELSAEVKKLTNKYKQMTPKERARLNDFPFISKLEQRRHRDRLDREKNREPRINFETMLSQANKYQRLENANNRIDNLNVNQNPSYIDENTVLGGFKAMGTPEQNEAMDNYFFNDVVSKAKQYLDNLQRYYEEMQMAKEEKFQGKYVGIKGQEPEDYSDVIQQFNRIAETNPQMLKQFIEEESVFNNFKSNTEKMYKEMLLEPLDNFVVDSWRMNDALPDSLEIHKDIPGIKNTLTDLAEKLNADKLYFEDEYAETIGVSVDDPALPLSLKQEDEFTFNIGGIGHVIYNYDVNDPVTKTRVNEIIRDIERIYEKPEEIPLQEWLGKFNSIQRLTALGIDGSPMTIHLLALAFFDPKAWAGAGKGFVTRLWTALKDPEARRARNQQFLESEANQYIENIFGSELILNRSGKGAFEVTEALEEGGILARIGQTRIGGAVQEAVEHSLDEAGRILAMSMADHAVKVNTWTVTHPVSGLKSKIPKRLLDRVSYLDPKTGERTQMNDLGEYVAEWPKPYDDFTDALKTGEFRSIEAKISRDLLDDEAYQEWALQKGILTGRDVRYLQGLGRERWKPFNMPSPYGGKLYGERPPVYARTGEDVNYDSPDRSGIPRNSLLPRITKEYDSFAIKELAQFINSIRGLANSAEMGVSAKQRVYESIFLLAPRYRRAVAAHYGKLWSADPVTRRMAQRSLLQFYGGMAFVVLSLQAMQSILEGDTEEQLLTKLTNILNPQSSSFMLFDVDGQKVGPGSKFTSDLRIVAKLSNYIWKEGTGQDIDEWEDVTSINRNNPAIKWVRAQLAASPSEGIDFILGNDFIGEPAYRGKNTFDFIRNSVKPLSENVIPLWLQSSLLEGTPDGIGWQENVRNRTLRGATEFVGFRAFPQGVTSILKESSYDVYNKGYSKLEPFEKDMLRVISQEKLNWLQDKQLKRATSDFAIYFADVDRINKEFQDAILAYMEIYPDTPEGNRDLYYRYGLLKNYRRGQLNEIGADIEFGEHDIENKDPIIKALARYNSLFDDPNIRVQGTQIIDWEKYDVLYDQLMNEMSEEQQIAIQRNSNRLPLPEKFLQRLSRVGTGKEYQKIMASQALREQRFKFNNKPELAERYRRYFLMIED
tara:strand:+ start:1862 stop:11635 length:9774 start_codon:yes stop_codon:yes gene_type:complete